MKVDLQITSGKTSEKTISLTFLVTILTMLNLEFRIFYYLNVLNELFYELIMKIFNDS